MRTVICDQIPLDRPGADARPVAGAAVYQATFLRALLKYGTYDRYVFIDRHAVHACPAASYAWSSDDAARRACVATVVDLIGAPVAGDVVLITPDPVLHGLYGLQRLLRRFESPCVGLVHALNRPELLAALLGSLVQPHRSMDALVCSSAAGRLVVERQLTHLAGMLAQTEWPPALRCPIIPLGIDDEYFQLPGRWAARREWGFRAEEIAITSIGRFSSRTKSDLRPLLLAFAEVRRSTRAQVRLVIAGDDTQEQETRSLLQFCGVLEIEPFVSIHPQIAHDRKRSLLAAADVFVAPSDNLQETFGLSVVEAMAAGLPVVAADWDGLRETVVDGETGVLVPTSMPDYDQPIDALSAVGATLSDVVTAQSTAVDVTQFANAIIAFVEHPRRRTAAGDAGRRRARERYHLRQVVAEHEALWSSLATDAQPSSPDADPDASLVFSPRSTSVFRHYSTRLLDEDAALTATPLGDRCLHAEGRALFAAFVGPGRTFRHADLERVLREVTERGPVSIRDLTATATNAAEAFVLQASAGRLLKYGALQFAAGVRAE
jgi:glycosyltransferase involved in cell wall biosynthesis